MIKDDIIVYAFNDRFAIKILLGKQLHYHANFSKQQHKQKQKGKTNKKQKQTKNGQQMGNKFDCSFVVLLITWQKVKVRIYVYFSFMDQINLFIISRVYAYTSESDN